MPKSPRQREESRYRGLQRAFWDARFRDAPDLARSESELARWCGPILASRRGFRDLVELGCGDGRDAVFLARSGFQVRAYDLSPEAIQKAQATSLGAGDLPRGVVRFSVADAEEALRSLEPRSQDVVYANHLYDMSFSERELRAIFSGVWRALRPRGLHVYSAWSDADPRARGARLRPDGLVETGPGIPPLRFTSLENLRRVSGGAFEPVAFAERSEDEEGMPEKSLFLVEERP